MTFAFENATIIGTGLIGASLSLALRAAGFTGTIAAADTNPAALEEAEALGLFDRYHTDPADAVAGAEIVILAIPVGAMGAAAATIGPALAEGAIVTDTGSVKGAVIAAMEGLPRHARFVPAHPIAGSENSGPSAGFPGLFANRWCILTPTHKTNPAALRVVADMWRAFGSNVEVMDIAHHDRVLALTSHLPHLIAYNIVRTASDLEEVTDAEVIKFSAGGFRDFTRLAASDPTMWRDVFLNNKEAVLETLGRFSEDLALLQRAIRWSDGDLLYDVFTRTRDIRRRVIDAGQDTAVPNFGRPAETGEEPEPSASPDTREPNRSVR
ncbi:MAG: prephenate/arogenate dehydrogenase family protein [Pseudomonadota bacterium]